MAGTPALADVVSHAPRFKADRLVPDEQGGARAKLVNKQRHIGA